MKGLMSTKGYKISSDLVSKKSNVEEKPSLLSLSSERRSDSESFLMPQCFAAQNSTLAFRMLLSGTG